MKSLISATHKLGIPIEQPENRARAARISAIDQETLLNVGKVFTVELGRDLQALWADRGIQEVYTQRSQFQLLDSTQYFFNEIERISDPNYVPHEQDVLRSRVKTTGIVETEFDFNSFKFRMFDVGGQRNERKKWIHCFEDVTSVIFVTALSEYDQKCYEDDTTPRMKESLVLFDEIVNSRYFAETPIILFLNKLDLFRDKIQHTDLKVCFPEYTGGSNFEPAAKYIEKQYLSLNKIDSRQIYTHFTTATDTNNIKIVFDSVKDILLKNNLALSARP